MTSLTQDDPILDLRPLITQLDGDLDAARTLLAMFLEDAGLILEELRALQAQPQEWRRFAIKIHGLKGACANVGAETMRAQCLALELTARQEDPDRVDREAIAAGLRATTAAFEAVRQRASVWLGSGASQISVGNG